jgi:uncharacterized protein YbjT (DUF2867 family)
MASINTRLTLKTKNVFTNTLNLRHDKTFAIDADAERAVKNIKAASGSPYTLLTVTDYGGDDKSIFIFLRNRSTTAAKYLYIMVGAQLIMRLSPGEYFMFPWWTQTSDDFKVYSNDPSNGVNLEYFVGKMK